MAGSAGAIFILAIAVTVLGHERRGIEFGRREQSD
jgi:hypothetical protein